MGERIQQIVGIIFSLAFIAILGIANTAINTNAINSENQMIASYGYSEMHSENTFLKEDEETVLLGSTLISFLEEEDVQKNNIDNKLAIAFKKTQDVILFSGFSPETGQIKILIDGTEKTTSYKVSEEELLDNIHPAYSYIVSYGRNEKEGSIPGYSYLTIVQEGVF